MESRITAFKTFVPFLLMACLGPAISQGIVQDLRFDKELQGADDHYMAFTLESEGVLMVRDNRNFDDGKKIWEITVLDTALQTTWATRLQTEPDYVLVGYEYKPRAFHLLFRKDRPDNFHGLVAQLDLARRSFALEPFKIELNLQLTHYTVAGNNTILGGTIGNQPAIAIFDQPTRRTNFLPGFFITDAELLDIRPNRNNTFSVIQMRKKPGSDELVFGAYDKDGKLLVEDRFQVSDGISLLSATASSLIQDEVLVAGTYTYGTIRQSAAAGIFYATIRPFEDNKLTFTDFTALDHFLDYLPEKRAASIKQKAEQRKTYGRNTDYRLHAAVRRIEEKDGEFIVFGEAWSVPSGNNSAMQGAPYPGYYRPGGFGYPTFWGPAGVRYGFDPFSAGTAPLQEYRMMNGFVIAVRPDGTKTWDQAAGLQETRLYSDGQHSDVLIHNKKATFAFPVEKGIGTGNLNGKSGTKPEAIPVKVRPEALSREDDFTDCTIRWWYGNHLYMCGEQDVTVGGDRHRVFFINRMRLTQ